MPDISKQQGTTDGRPIRVCHIVATTESIIWPVNQLVRLRDDYGYEVAAIVSGEEGPLVDRFRAAGIPVFAADFDFPSLPNVEDTITKSLALAQLFRRERFDIVQTALWHSMVLGRFAAWLADVPVRLVMHAGPYYLDAPIHRWIDASTTWMETFLIGCCKDIVKTYHKLGVSKDRLELVYYAPDETRFDPATTERSKIREEYGWPEDTPLISHVSWFYPRIPDLRWAPAITRGKDLKGHEELIRSAPYVLREFPNAKILLVGTAFVWQAEPVIADMKALVKELGLEESVIFTGFRPTVNDVLLASDVAVQPSLSEGCGGTFESLLLERPTVGTRIGGIPDMVIDGVTGVLVNPADPVDLARGICDLLRDPERARAMGKAGRRHVLGTATLGRTISDLDRLYRQWLFPDGTRRPGYRWWVMWLRLPILHFLGIYLNWRLRVVEYQFMTRWEAGWRPWHVGPSMRSARLRAARLATRIPWAALTARLPQPTDVAARLPQPADVAAALPRPAEVAATIPVPGRTLVPRWYGKFRRGDARLDRATARLVVLDLIAAQPPTLRTFIYESIAEYRHLTRGDARPRNPRSDA